MNILGVTHPVGADAAACLVQDGQLIAFCEEERFTRQKHAFNAVPRNAINKCLEMADLTIRDIDEIAIGFAPPNPKGQTGSNELDQKLGNGRARFDFYDNELRASFAKITYVDHYRAHALSVAPYFSGRPANILAIDGWGGDFAGGIFYTEGEGKLRQLMQIPTARSLGLFFQFVTSHLGFRPHCDEGKTMALAAYGDLDEKLLPDWCDIKTGLPDLGQYIIHLERLKRRLPQESIEDEHRRLAATAQHYLERAVVRLARFAFEGTNCGNFGLTGGVALNCVANGCLASEEFVHQVIVPPAANDAGTALGAAVASYVDRGKNIPSIPTKHAYLGPHYDADDVTAALSFARLPKTDEDPIRAAVLALCEQKTVGLFVGAAEVGPRALGARSILANPAAAGMKKHVNARVKRRESWRPFAPAVLESHVSEVLRDGRATPFMTITDRLSDKWRQQLPGIVHVDGTTRAQLVSPGHNRLFYSILDGFYQITGIPALLNTSFNLNDEPMVLAPDHAIATFYRGGLDLLVFENAVLRKPS